MTAEAIPTRAVVALWDEQRALWDDLAEAMRRAINGMWSMECDWKCERIMATARLVGWSSEDEMHPMVIPIFLQLSTGRVPHSQSRISYDDVKEFAPATPRRLVDISDARRAAKPWLPASDADVTDGRVLLVDYPGVGLRPACDTHGAMARVSAVGRLYRCQEERCGVGGEMVDA